MRALLLLLFLLSVAVPASADPPDEPVPVPEDVHRPRTAEGIKWFAEVGVGLNYTMLSANTTYRRIEAYEGANTTDLFESSSGIGYFSYAAVGVRLSPLLGLSLREDYDIRNTSGSMTTIDTGTSVTGPVDKEYSVKITYSIISLLAELHFDDLLVYVGPSIGVGLDREQTETQTAGEGFAFFAGTQFESRTVTATLTEADGENLALRFAVKLGVGYSFELAPHYTLIHDWASIWDLPMY